MESTDDKAGGMPGEDSQPTENGAKSTEENRAVRRPTTLLRERGLRFVNRMRNVGWLAGYSAPGDENTFLLQQTNNIEQALHIHVNKKYVSVTKVAGRPLMAMVHVRGYRDEHGAQVSLHCIELNKPSILDLPIDTVWVSGFGQGKEASKVLSKLSKSNFTPFDSKGQLRPEFSQYISSADSEKGTFELDDRAKSFIKAHEMFGDVLAASGGVIDSRLDRGQNYVSIAGFVDSKAFIPATQHRKEYGLVMLRQQEDPEENIPVRVIGRMAKAYIESVKEGAPILVEGSVRRKVIPNDAGEIVSTHTYIETTRISGAQVDKDIMSPTPAWWLTIRDRLVARSSQRAAQAQPKPKPIAAADLSALAQEG
jgi:hypothetical protein